MGLVWGYPKSFLTRSYTVHSNPIAKDNKMELNEDSHYLWVYMGGNNPNQSA